MPREFDYKNWVREVLELEEINKNFEPEEPPAGYPPIWLPGDGKIRLWSVPRTTGQVLYTEALSRKPHTMLELGTSAGYSALWLGLAARELGSNFYTIEVARPKSDWAEINIEDAGLNRHVHILKGWINRILLDWKRDWYTRSEEKIDFVFLDADKPKYFAYLKLLEPLLSEGALLIADNAGDFAYDMRKYLKYVRSNRKYKSRYVDMDNGLEITTKVK